jgi:hypothetical protein
MFPYVLEISTVWSVLFVVIKVLLMYLPLPSLYGKQVSRKSQQKWNDFVEKLNKTRCNLEILCHHATWFKDKDGPYELMNAICNSLVRLVDYWIEVIRWCRQNPTGFIALIL